MNALLRRSSSSRSPSSRAVDKSISYGVNSDAPPDTNPVGLGERSSREGEPTAESRPLLGGKPRENRLNLDSRLPVGVVGKAGLGSVIGAVSLGNEVAEAEDVRVDAASPMDEAS